MKKAEAWKITSNLLVYSRGENDTHWNKGVYRRKLWKDVIGNWWLVSMEKGIENYSNNGFHFVHNDFKVLVDFGGQNIQQAVLKWAFHSFLRTCQALC